MKYMNGLNRDFLAFDAAEMKHIEGISKDGRRVTAIDCVGPGLPGHSSYYGRTRRTVTVKIKYADFR